MSDRKWLLGGTKDSQSITSDWELVNQNWIDGVTLRDVRNVPKDTGYLTEIFRREWLDGNAVVDQVFQVTIFGGQHSAWHTHGTTTDRLFVNNGQLKIVLFDSREESPTFGSINEVRLGVIRPGLVIIPPRVWHGVFNLSNETASVLNLVDRAYEYDDPDHWRLPSDSPQIPYCVTHGRSCGCRV